MATDEGFTLEEKLLKNQSFLLSNSLPSGNHCTDNNCNEKDEGIDIVPPVIEKQQEDKSGVNFKPIPKEFLPLVRVLISKIKRMNYVATTAFAASLQGHMGVRNDFPWLDLDAAYILGIHPDIHQVAVLRKIEKPSIPGQIKMSLQSGQFVSMEHIIYGLHCASDSAKLDSLAGVDFTSIPVPQEFVKKIKRCDVLRGMNVHILFLGIKYPSLSQMLLELMDELWTFMFCNTHSASAGIELYNQFFLEFGKQLAMNKFIGLNCFPAQIMDAVATANPVKRSFTSSD